MRTFGLLIRKNNGTGSITCRSPFLSILEFEFVESFTWSIHGFLGLCLYKSHCIKTLEMSDGMTRLDNRSAIGSKHILKAKSRNPKIYLISELSRRDQDPVLLQFCENETNQFTKLVHSCHMLVHFFNSNSA